MKSKFALPALAVCCSVALLGAYVVYAQRQPQPSVPEAGPVDVLASSGEPRGHALHSSVETDASVITSSNIEGPIFRSSSLPSMPEEVAALPRLQDHALVGQSSSPETVRFRVNGSTVTTRIAPAGPAPLNGHVVKLGAFRNSVQPKLVSIPRSSPTQKEASANPALQTVAHDSPVQTAAPRPRLLAPGSRSMDLRVLDQPPVLSETPAPATAVESSAPDKPTAS